MSIITTSRRGGGAGGGGSGALDEDYTTTNYYFSTADTRIQCGNIGQPTGDGMHEKRVPFILREAVGASS